MNNLLDYNKINSFLKKKREEVQSFYFLALEYNLQRDYYFVKINLQILPCSDIDKNTRQKRLSNLSFEQLNYAILSHNLEEQMTKENEWVKCKRKKNKKKFLVAKN